MELTQKAIRELELPESGRMIVRDDGCRYLRLFLTPTGRSWYYCRRWADGWGEKTQKRLGQWPDLSLTAARGLAMDWSEKIAMGIDPAKKEAEPEAPPTVGALWERYMKEHLEQHTKRPETSAKLWGGYLGEWSKRVAGEVTLDEVRALHRKIGTAHGHHMANRAMQLLRAIYNHAGMPNPVRGLTLYRERSRDRFMSADELRRFLAWTKQHRTVAAEALEMMLWTGARRSNVQAMRWDSVNMEAAVWLIPEDEAKAGQAIMVPLVAPAMEILRRRAAAKVRKKSHAKYVFPGRHNSQTPHLTEVKSAWSQMLEDTGIQNLRVHDLRRTMGSWQAATGASLPVIGKSLGHRSQAATQVYARLDLDPVRQSVEAATAAMLAAAGGEGRRPD